MAFEESTYNPEALISEIELNIKQMKHNNGLENFGVQELNDNYTLLQRSAEALQKLQHGGYDEKKIAEYNETLDNIRNFLAEKEDYLEKRGAMNDQAA